MHIVYHYNTTVSAGWWQLTSGLSPNFWQSFRFDFVFARLVVTLFSSSPGRGSLPFNGLVIAAVFTSLVGSWALSPTSVTILPSLSVCMDVVIIWRHGPMMITIYNTISIYIQTQYAWLVVLIDSCMTRWKITCLLNNWAPTVPGDSPNIKYRVIIVSISTCTIFLLYTLSCCWWTVLE